MGLLLFPVFAVRYFSVSESEGLLPFRAFVAFASASGVEVLNKQTTSAIFNYMITIII